VCAGCEPLALHGIGSTGKDQKQRLKPKIKSKDQKQGLEPLALYGIGSKTR
jgi:hypothetical protein